MYANTIFVDQVVHPRGMMVEELLTQPWVDLKKATSGFLKSNFKTMMEMAILVGTKGMLEPVSRD
jgi:hypothetical protein